MNSWRDFEKVTPRSCDREIYLAMPLHSRIPGHQDICKEKLLGKVARKSWDVGYMIPICVTRATNFVTEASFIELTKI